MPDQRAKRCVRPHGAAQATRADPPSATPVRGQARRCAADDPIDAARELLTLAAWPSTEVARPEPSADVNAGWQRVDHDLSDVQWKALRASWGGCAYCGATDRPLQRDCVLAISRGGRYTLDNVVPACGPCNASKCNDEVTGWLRRRRFDERAFLLRQLEVRTALGLQPGSKPAVEAGVADTPHLHLTSAAAGRQGQDVAGRFRRRSSRDRLIRAREHLPIRAQRGVVRLETFPAGAPVAHLPL